MNWWDVFANASVSFLVAVIVGVIIRFKLKPKHEEVFEHNRNVNLMMVFGLLNNLDFQFEQFIIIFEKKLGPFTKYRKRILPTTEWRADPEGGEIADLSSSMDIRMTYEDVKTDLRPTVENLYKVNEQLREDYKIFENYIHANFLRDVSLYIFNTSYFAEWALKDAPLPSCMIKRMDYAKKIIKYVESDNSIDTKYQSIDSFIKRWKEEFKIFDK